MRVRTKPEASHADAARPFFSAQTARTSNFFSTSPFAVAAQMHPEPVDDEAIEQSPVIQTKLTMGAPGDRFELEADSMADRVVQRMHVGAMRPTAAPSVQAKCTECREEEKLQRQADGASAPEERLQAKGDGSMDVPGSVQRTLEGGGGGGHTMQPAIRDEMESAFETDFSGVRIHTGTSAETLNQDLSAHAFTYGQDIYFNAGEYQPDSPQGRHLLAHELTHVVQQNPGLQRKPKAESVSGALTPTAGTKVQAAVWSFGPPYGWPKGTIVHNDVLPMFAAANIAGGIFIEVSIPGANKTDVDTGRRGIADFYKVAPAPGDGKSRTLGLQFGDAGPEFLKPSSRMEGGGAKYIHSQDSAPRGGVHQPRVRDADKAAKTIELGDLKPGSSAEAYDGRSQLNNYKSGINNTAASLAKWLADPANSNQANDSGNWHPTVTDIGPKGLTIPKQLDFSSGAKGLYPYELAVYKDGKIVDLKSGLKGAMYVYPHHSAGIWAYEWFPFSVPATTGSPTVEKALKRLVDEVIQPVKSTGQSAALPGVKPIRRREKRQVRRKEDGFPYARWQLKYRDWKTDTEAKLAKPEEKRHADVAEALVDVDKRSGHKLNLPEPVKERGLAYAKIRHWLKFGGIYGWLRNTFDGVYTKVKKLADKIKKKISGLAKKVGSTSFGSWVKAAAKVIFKIFKIVAKWAITQVVDRLVSSFQEGLQNNINKLIDAIIPEGVKSAIEEFHERKEQWETLVKAKEEELEKRIFGDKLDLFEKLEEWEAIANTASTILTLVEWGVRLIACLSPPAIGCLWNLLISALQAAFALLMQTCWFTQKVYAPVMSAIKPVRDFPTVIAKFVVDKANEVIPLPAGMEPLFAPIVLDQNEIKVECGEEGGGEGGGGAALTEEQRAILELIQEIGEEKFKALLELMLKRGAGPWVQLTLERIKELKKVLAQVRTEDLKKAAAQPESGTPQPLENFLADIAKIAPAKERKIDYKQAERQNAYYKQKIGWDPETFINKPGIKEDSKEFADAVYDMQEATGAFKDGVAGPVTTLKFYQVTKVPHDAAYAKAVKVAEEEKQAQAEKKAVEERRKKVEALLQDEKVKAAMAEPFPSEDQLKKDLASLHWENLGDGVAAFVKIGGRAIIAMKTENGHRLGAHFHFVEREDKGMKKTMALDTSRFYALDTVDRNEAITFSTVDEEGRYGLLFLALQGQKKDSFSPASYMFFSSFVEFE